MIDRAKPTFKHDIFYVDDFLEMGVTKQKHTKIFVNNAFFYVHPKR